jgi:hypothetical protein
MNTIDQIPLWALFVIFVLMTSISVEYGFRLGARHRDSSMKDNHAPVGSMIASALALLAFMLAFTFNLAASRFNDRRVLVIDEANAIGTTYLRTEFLEEPLRAKVKSLLREYVALQIKSSTDLQTVAESIPQSDILQDRIWSAATQAAQLHIDSPIYALFISSLNEVIDLHATRTNTWLRARVPGSIWLALLMMAALCMTGTGYYCGLTDTRNWIARTVLVACFATVMLLVVDLDRPWEGSLRVNQQPMIDLSKEITAP